MMTSSTGENKDNSVELSSSKIDEAKPLFKPKKRKRQIRKRPLEEIQEDAEDPLEKERLKLIETTKDIQKLRDRKKGIDATAALRLPVLSEHAGSPPSSPSFGSPKEVQKESNNNIVTLQFTQEKSPTVEDQFLSKYIAEKMKELKNQDIKSMKEFQALLEAEKLENEIRREKEALKIDSQVSQAQPPSLTTVPEVPLPDKYKIDNIIETAKAEQALIQKKQLLEQIKQQLAADGLLEPPQFRFQQENGSVDPVPQSIQQQVLPDELSRVVVPKPKSDKPTDSIVFDKYVKTGKK